MIFFFFSFLILPQNWKQHNTMEIQYKSRFNTKKKATENKTTIINYRLKI